ncbi:kelch repeat protein [Ancylostoma duodenale]|uniref:Kelch repeat protein n=1 Tax=Ancylostoma duodenale TaxID=51022 RepID=A0A0C2GIT7_9BILA|nr:kelch repeat protein [Ancylostoma duodenale]
MYACSGGDSHGYHEYSVQVYDPRDHSWRVGVPMSKCRCAVAVVVLDGYIYVLGLRNGEVERFAPGTGKWEELPKLGKERAFFGATAMNGKIYVCGGSFTKCDYGAINAYLASVNWINSFESVLSVNEKYNMFIDILHHAVDLFVPRVYVYPHKINLPPYLRKMLEHKECLHAYAKATGDWQTLQRDGTIAITAQEKANLLAAEFFNVYS